MFLHLSVSHSVNKGSVCQTPPGRHPPGRHPQADTPRQTPLDRHPWTDTPILGRHPLPLGRHPRADTPPSQQMATAADGTLPTGMHSCDLNNFISQITMTVSEEMWHHCNKKYFDQTINQNSNQKCLSAAVE